jgi:transglutaminase-like putative cysteine protease
LIYAVSHRTRYSYSATVSISQNAVYLRPREIPGRQTCRVSRIEITPRPVSMREARDAFGNAVVFFTVREAHDVFEVHAESEVELLPFTPPSAPAPWEAARGRLRAAHGEDLDAYAFAFGSPFVSASAEMLDYARVSFASGRPLDDAVRDLTSRIHRDFQYDNTATTVATPLSEVMKDRRGVCQDFAHLEIGCLRSLGLAARYVSGYLLTTPPPGKTKLRGADASHAWISVYAPGAGWLDLDPTNDCAPSDQHITLAWGRDFGDVIPVKGAVHGGGEHEVRVSVDVERK